jgi:hypothetical protein
MMLFVRINWQVRASEFAREVVVRGHPSPMRQPVVHRGEWRLSRENTAGTRPDADGEEDFDLAIF